MADFYQMQAEAKEAPTDAPQATSIFLLVAYDRCLLTSSAGLAIVLMTLLTQGETQWPAKD